TAHHPLSHTFPTRRSSDLKAPENIPLAQKLAKAIGGEIAASRPICDEGWLPMDRQIGSSGQTVAPKLYLALGISGAIQHVVGMKIGRAHVAVNKDQIGRAACRGSRR